MNDYFPLTRSNAFTLRYTSVQRLPEHPIVDERHSPDFWGPLSKEQILILKINVSGTPRV